MFALDSDNELTKEKEELRLLQKKYESLDSCIDKSREKELCAISDFIRGQKKRKKQKSAHLRPVAFARFNTRIGEPKRDRSP